MTVAASGHDRSDGSAANHRCAGAPAARGEDRVVHIAVPIDRTT